MHGDIGYNLNRINSNISSIILHCTPLALQQSCSRNIYYFGWEELNIGEIGNHLPRIEYMMKQVC